MTLYLIKFIEKTTEKEFAMRDIITMTAATVFVGAFLVILGGFVFGIDSNHLLVPGVFISTTGAIAGILSVIVKELKDIIN